MALSIKDRIVIAGLVVEGKNVMADGYLLTHPKTDKSVKPDSLYKMASRWWNRQDVKNYRREVAARLGTASDGQSDAMTDTEIMTELTKAARAEADQTKKSQILMRVAEMKSRLAEADPEKENRRVVMYLPFSCDCRQCELYHRERERRNGSVEK